MTITRVNTPSVQVLCGCSAKTTCELAKTLEPGYCFQTCLSSLLYIFCWFIYLSWFHAETPSYYSVLKCPRHKHVPNCVPCWSGTSQQGWHRGKVTVSSDNTQGKMACYEYDSSVMHYASLVFVLLPTQLAARTHWYLCRTQSKEGQGTSAKWGWSVMYIACTWMKWAMETRTCTVLSVPPGSTLLVVKTCSLCVTVC